MAYTTVHCIVRYELGAKLKVPPPRQQQQTVGVQEDVKTSKTSSPSQSLASGQAALCLSRFCQDESRWGLLTLTGRRGIKRQRIAPTA